MVKLKLLIILLISVNCYSNKITDSIYWIGTASSSAIGFSNTAKTNSSDSLFYNPAGLGTLSESSINLSYSSIYSTDFSSINLVGKHDLMAFGIGINLNQSNDIDETTYDETSNTITKIGTYNYSYSTIFFSGSLKLPWIPSSHIGSTLHIHRMNFGDDVLVGESLNIGLLFAPFNFLSIGYNAYNIIPLYLRWNQKNIYDEGALLTSIHKINNYSTIGIELTPINLKSIKWTILADLELENSESTLTSDTISNYSPLKLGTELNISFLTVKGGYNYRNTSIGVSTRLEKFKIHYTFIMPSNIEYFDNRNSVGFSIFL